MDPWHETRQETERLVESYFSDPPLNQRRFPSILGWYSASRNNPGGVPSPGGVDPPCRWGRRGVWIEGVGGVAWGWGRQGGGSGPSVGLSRGGGLL